MRRWTAAALVLLTLLSPLSALATGGQGTSNYLYTPWGYAAPVPPAYTLHRSLTANLLEGVSSLSGLVDVCVTDDAIFVLRQTQLIVLGRNWAVREVIAEYQDGGQTIKFEGNGGIFATAAGDYYITQPEKARILHFEADGTLRRVLGRPDITGFESVSYRPTRLVVDSVGRMFVIAKGMYEGIVELRSDGAFSRFYGVNKVSFSFADMVWRLIATEEQRKRMALWLPTDFTSLCLDSDGFIFATVQGEQTAVDSRTIKRLNAKGENILKLPKDQPYPRGDLWFNDTGIGVPVGASSLIAIDTNDSGVFLALDGKRARLFAYNEDGKLLFVFGGLGDREGYFRNPVDVAFAGDDIVVLDQLAEAIEVFSPTEYGAVLMSAVSAQHTFDYEASTAAWREALSYNANLSLAYAGIGRALLREKRYEEALTYLEQGNDRSFYSKAFTKVRNEKLRAWFAPGVAAAFALVVLVTAVRLIKKRRGRAKRPAGEVTA